MKHYLLTLLLCMLTLHSTPLSAQRAAHSDAHMTGHITDSDNGEHIPYAAILIKGTQIGITADATGHFLLKNIPAGTHTVVVSFTGYETLEQMVEIKAHKTIEAKFVLTPKSITVDEVVVTGSRNESKKRESTSIVNVISTKQFENTASTCMAEALNYQPGLRVEYNCSNCGVPQLRINGLEGQYSQILLDSRPVFSSLSAVYGLEQLPVGMVERVEVIRGGGSALFGSSAIGGVVNIITKQPTRNSVSLSNSSNFFEGGGTDITTTLNASVVSDDQKTGIFLFGNIKDRSWYDRNGDGFSEVPTLSSETLGFRAYHRTHDNGRLTAEYHHTREFRRGGNNFKMEPHEADIAEQLRHQINGGGLKYDLWTDDSRHRSSFYGSMQDIRRESYFGTEQDLDAYGKTKDMTFVVGGQHTYEFDHLWFLPAQLTGGIEHTNNKLHDEMLGYNRIIDQRSTCTGGYLQNEWKNKQWGFLIGGRLDKHNMVDNAVFSPRANARYAPNESLTFRMSYASGYRAPQVYDEDLHVAAVGGDVAIIQVAENLKPEYSNSVSGSVDFYHRFGSVETNLLVEGFYTHLEDVFALVKVGEDALGNTIFERQNEAGATIAGVNLELKAGFSRQLVFNGGLTLQRSRYDEAMEWSEEVAAQRKMFRAPNTYGFATLDYMPINPLTLSFRANYTGKMLVQHNAGYVEQDEDVTTPNFWDLGFRASYKMKLSNQLTMEIGAGVKNILDSFQKDLDRGIDRDAGFIYGPVTPRTYFVEAKFSL